MICTFGRISIWGFLLVGVLSFMSPSIGRAHEVTFDFSGTFVAADPHSLGGILTAPVGPFPASTLSGSFTFDADTLDANAGDHHIGQYTGAVTNVSLSVTNIFGAPYEFGFNSSGSLKDILVSADHVVANQSYTMQTNIQNVVPSGPIVDGDNYFAREFFINLLKPSTEVFASDALPSVPPDHALFSLYDAASNPDGQFRLVLASSHGDHTLIGNLTSLTLSTIPIPAAVYLFGSGIIGLISLARRKMHATA